MCPERQQRIRILPAPFELFIDLKKRANHEKNVFSGILKNCWNLGDREGGGGGCPMRGRSENLNFLDVGLPYECGVKFLRGGSYPSAIVAHCNNTRASWATDMENCVSEKTDYRKISRDER